MSRRARRGLVAAIVIIFGFCFVSLQPSTQAQSAALTHKIFMSGLVVPPPSTGPQLSALELQAIELINGQRRANGCPAVQLNTELTLAAKRHSQDLADNNLFSHTGSDGSNFVQRAKAAGYTAAPSGEIIAGGHSTAAAVVDGWMNSPGHRTIILTCAHDDIGIGLVDKAGSQYRLYWTAVFGQR